MTRVQNELDETKIIVVSRFDGECFSTSFYFTSLLARNIVSNKMFLLLLHIISYYFNSLIRKLDVLLAVENESLNHPLQVIFLLFCL